MPPLAAALALFVAAVAGIPALPVTGHAAWSRGAAAAALQSAPPAQTAESAVGQVVEANGDVYAGPCAATRSPDDIGKVCSTLIEERDDLRAYLTGRTFSEYSLWVFVRRADGGWLPSGTAPLDFLAMEVAVPWPE